VYHDRCKPEFAFWAEQLDREAIPWSVQNTVAVTAEDKTSMGLYLSTRLNRNVRAL
jgi:hypothetical protein